MYISLYRREHVICHEMATLNSILDQRVDAKIFHHRPGGLPLSRRTTVTSVSGDVSVNR